MGNDTKRCSRCENDKHIQNDFHRNKSSKDGRQSICKDCHREIKRLSTVKKNPRAVEYKSWSKSDVLNEIKIIRQRRQSLTSYEMQSMNSRLYNAAKRLYGSWGNAVEQALGINYKETIAKYKLDYWNADTISKELRKVLAVSKDLNAKYLSAHHSDLYYAIIKEYNSVAIALETLGIDYNNHNAKLHNYWNKDKIKQEISRLNTVGENLSSSNIQNNYRKLYKGSLLVFGSWENALTYSGFDYGLIREDALTLSRCGTLFEGVVVELLIDLGVTYKRHERVNGCVPDFTLKNNVWVDAKLSEWSIFNCNTLRKYEPNSRLLTIIFMRGDKNMDKMLTSKTRIMSVYNLIKQLPKQRQSYYRDKITNLEKSVNTIESEDSSEVSGF